MLASPCPRCGQPGPVSIASPDRQSCDACGYSGATSEGVRERLRRAAHVLTGIDARKRKLSTWRRWLLLSNALLGGCFLALATVLLLPFGCLAWIGSDIFLEGARPDATGFLTCAGPLAAMLPAVIIGYLFVLRHARRLREASTALPPARPGDPAGCHVCGGPVRPEGTAPVATCAFCSADNVITAEALAAAGTVRSQVLDDFEGEVALQAVSVHKAMRRMMIALVLYALVAPIFGSCCMCSLALVGESIDTPLDESIEYVWAETARGRCVARVERADDGRISFRFTRRISGGAPVTFPDRDGPLETFGAPALVGMRLANPMQDGRYHIGDVLGVHGELSGENQVVMRFHSGASTYEASLPAASVCVPPPDALVYGDAPPDWPAGR